MCILMHVQDQMFSDAELHRRGVCDLRTESFSWLFCYFWQFSSHLNSSFFPLRAGSGTVQLVTGWERICLLLTRQGSLVRTMEPPLLPLPIGTYGIVLPHSDLKVITVCFVSADFLKVPLYLSKVRAGLRQQPGVRSLWWFLLDRPPWPGQPRLLPLAQRGWSVLHQLESGPARYVTYSMLCWMTVWMIYRHRIISYWSKMELNEAELIIKDEVMFNINLFQCYISTRLIIAGESIFTS